MFKVLLLICAISVEHRDCKIDSALTVMQGPEAESQAACAFQSQAYIARTAIAATMTDNEYLKITCTRTTIGKQTVG